MTAPFWCLFRGHVPNQMYEFSRSGMHRATYCERCGVQVTHVVSVGRPLPEGAVTMAENFENAVRNVMAELVPPPRKLYTRVDRKAVKPDVASSLVPNTTETER